MSCCVCQRWPVVFICLFAICLPALHSFVRLHSEKFKTHLICMNCSTFPCFPLSPLLICCCPEYHLIRHRAATIKLMRIYNCLNTPRERRSWIGVRERERGRVLFYLQCKIRFGVENNENVISFPHNTPIHSISHAPSAYSSCSSSRVCLPCSRCL